MPPQSSNQGILQEATEEASSSSGMASLLCFSSRGNSNSSTSDVASIQEKLRIAASHDDDFSSMSMGLKGCLSTSNLASLDSNNNNNTSKKSSIKRNVSFHQVQIRSYERALGDNPSVRAGPAISLGWQYNETQPIEFEDYETNRPQARTRQQLLIPRQVREDMLRNDCGVTQQELLSAVKKTNITRNQRRTTAASTDSAEKAQYVLQKASRKFKTMFRISKNTKKEEQVLWNQAYNAAVQRSHSMSDLRQYEEQEDDIAEFRRTNASTIKPARACFSSVDLTTLSSQQPPPPPMHDLPVEGETKSCDADEWGFFGVDEADE
eukprot:CAMPEP_0119005390 /NCGR_PEP_ID=MMETSP1176-20130426/1691_1 /TAXON_ID=265551 /ORGANISM="Synedropsis recta cf, Strain CCMP1620" /LENGTH=321 /DNA_ID=CAMNT_0006957189 /DNA_START=49 /DNA_END=1014 /DNA_ORIENTATION=+